MIQTSWGPGRDTIWTDEMHYVGRDLEAKAMIREKHHHGAITPSGPEAREEAEKVESRDVAIALIVLVGFIGLVVAIMTML